MEQEKGIRIPEEGHPDPNHCLNSYSVQCCLKQLLSHYYAETPEYNSAICDLLGYLTKDHPGASSIVNWLMHQKKHPHFISWSHKTTLDEAKQALLVIIASPNTMNEEIPMEDINKQRLLVLEKFATKLPEFREVLGIEIAA